MSESLGEISLPNLEVSAMPAPAPVPAAKGLPRVKPVDRSQMVLQTVDVEQLIEEDHPARAIWEFVGQLDLSPFYSSIEAVEGVAGRQAWDPRLLMSVWIYAYSRGISSAREICRRCQYEPAFQWLAVLQVINYHTLSDFRTNQKERLEQVFVEVLGVLSSEGLVSLERVTQDGTKIKAYASKKSFRGEEHIQEHLEIARQQVKAMEAQGENYPQKAARQRAVKERDQRLTQAKAELDKIRQSKAAEDQA